MNIPADKYNVAWFKLAECVSRGEKERALGVYRLLSHSLSDKAFASQLEGDILSAFDDKNSAKERYNRAISLYKKDKRLLEMAAIGENMHFLYPKDRFYIELLIDTYTSLSIKYKATVYLNKFVTLSLGERDEPAAIDILDRYEATVAANELVIIRQQLVYALVKTNSLPFEQVIQQIKKTIDGLWLTTNNDTNKNHNFALQQFLASIQELNDDYYLHATEYLDQH